MRSYVNDVISTFVVQIWRTQYFWIWRRYVFSKAHGLKMVIIKS